MAFPSPRLGSTEVPNVALASFRGLGYPRRVSMQTRIGVNRAARAVWLLFQLPTLLRLYWRLLGDRRVPLWPKAVLVGALAYVASPVDLISDLVPLIGQLDDLALLALVGRMFLAWCPADVVAEHARALRLRFPV